VIATDTLMAKKESNIWDGKMSFQYDISTKKYFAIFTLDGVSHTCEIPSNDFSLMQMSCINSAERKDFLKKKKYKTKKLKNDYFNNKKQN